MLRLSSLAGILSGPRSNKRTTARTTRLAFERLGSRRLLAGVSGDFNGDGFEDLAVGTPQEDVAGVTDAGAVNVIYGQADYGLTAADNQLWDDRNFELTAHSEDLFGSALATGDFNGDGFDDLAIGVPGYDIDFYEYLPNVGRVQILFGSDEGLNTIGAIDFHHVKEALDHPYNNVLPVPDGRYGSALAVGDFDHDGHDDLAVGIPRADVNSIQQAGKVEILYGILGVGLERRNFEFLSQGTTGILGSPDIFDRFGAALAAGDFDNNGGDDLAIGVPNEAVNGRTDAGAVNVIYGRLYDGLRPDGNQLWHQDAQGITDTAESGDLFGASLAAGDFNGDSLDDLAIGVPKEDLFGYLDAGAVAVLYGSTATLRLGSTGDQLWHQNQTGVADEIEAGDQFGFAIRAADINNDGKDDLAIGVPFEDIRVPSGLSYMNVIDAGAVHVLFGAHLSLSTASSQFWTVETLDFGRYGSQTSGFFGRTLAVGDYDGDGRNDLSIGSPGRNIASAVGAGAVFIRYNSPTGLNNEHVQIWFQGKSDDFGTIIGAAEGQDGFGSELG